MKTLAERLKWCVEHRAQSARKLSLAAGLSAGAIQKMIERGSERVSPDDLARIAQAAGVSVRWLSLNEGEPETATSVEHRSDPATSPAGPPVALPRDGSPMELALGRAFDPEIHLARDLCAVESAMVDVIHSVPVSGGLGPAVRSWLDAAAALRREGRPVTAQTILVHVTMGGSPSS